MRKKIENPWKLAFFALIGILIGTLLFVWIRINETGSKKSNIAVEAVTNEEPTFQVCLGKEQANKLINHYLQALQKDSSLKYQFTLENQAVLAGTFGFLGHDLEFNLYFEPEVLENGDVQLEATSMSIGTLSLPVSEILKYARTSYKLPEWVEINPKDKTIIVHLSKYVLKNGMNLKAEQIDLEADDIKFGVYLGDIE
jgi:uncharacterized protein YpmS